MRATPDQTSVEWLASGVRLRVKPLAPTTSLSAVTDALGFGWLAMCIGALPIGLAQSFGLITSGPAAMMGAFCFLAGLLGAGVFEVRNTGSVLILDVMPGQLVLRHEVAGVRVVTTELELADVRAIRLTDDGTLVISTLHGPTIHEPMPALSQGTRRWIVGLIREAREDGQAFLRDQLRHHDEAKRLEAVVSATRPT